LSARVYLGLAGNALTVVVVGFAVLYALGLARRRSDIKLLALAYLVGWAALGVVISYLLMAGFDADLKTVLASAAVIVGLCTVAGRFSPRMPQPAGRPAAQGGAGGPLARLAVVVGALIILLAAVSAVVLAVRSTWKLDYDVATFWLPRADVIYSEHGLSLGPEGWQMFLHPEYPPLVPAMDAVNFHFVGGFHPALLAFQQCVLGLAFVGALLALLERRVPRWLSFPSIALLVVSPGFFNRLNSLLPDQTLAYFVALAALACLLWLRERRGAWLALTLLLLVTATLTKLEGEMYGLLLALIGCAGAVLRRKAATALPAALLFLGPAAIEPWRRWLGAHGLPTSAKDYHLSSLLHPLFLADRVGRIPYALEGVLTALFRPSEWLPILPLALLAILVVSRRLPLLAAATTLWLVLAFLGLIVVYWIGNEPVHLYVDETAHRVAGTIVIVAASVLPLVLTLALEKPGAGDTARSPGYYRPPEAKPAVR
jgi:hypothetical protein